MKMEEGCSKTCQLEEEDDDKEEKRSAVMTCLFHCSISGTKLKLEKNKCSDDVSVPDDELKKIISSAELKRRKYSNAVMCQFWHRILSKETKGKQRRKEGAAQPLHHACQACHNHTQEHTSDLQYPWRNPP